jgi:hypothetical protein
MPRSEEAHVNNTIGARTGLTLIATMLLVISVPAASAQPASATGPGTVSWRVEASRDSVALRDIARTGTPVDASPVAWTGDGPGLLVRHTRQSGRRTHGFEFSATRASHFVLKSPLESLARPNGDAFNRIEARYEYRRYLFSNVLVDGLDIGAAVQGGGTRTHLTRHFDGDLELTESRMAFRTAFVAAVRFRRGSRFGLGIDWANGGHIDHATERHSADSASTITRSGGGWLTDLVVAGDVAISSHASIAVKYLSSDEALMSSHRNFTTARRSWILGVVYAK